MKRAHIMKIFFRQIISVLSKYRLTNTDRKNSFETIVIKINFANLPRYLKLGRNSIFILFSLSLMACATTHYKPYDSPRTSSVLEQGKRDFNGGYYKSAKQELLPLACDGNAEAQYAVGYMYYYGYGVAQDTDVGFFWINRSANQAYPPAISARMMITQNAKMSRQTLKRRY